MPKPNTKRILFARIGKLEQELNDLRDSFFLEKDNSVQANNVTSSRNSNSPVEQDWSRYDSHSGDKVGIGSDDPSSSISAAHDSRSNYESRFKKDPHPLVKDLKSSDSSKEFSKDIVKPKENDTSYFHNEQVETSSNNEMTSSSTSTRNSNTKANVSESKKSSAVMSTFAESKDKLSSNVTDIPGFNILAEIKKLEKLKEELTKKPQPATESASTQQARKSSAKTNTRPDSKGPKLGFTSSKSNTKSVKNKLGFNILAAISKLEKLKGELTEMPQPATALASTEQAREISSKTDTRPDTQRQKLLFASSKSVKNKPGFDILVEIKKFAKLNEELSKISKTAIASASLVQTRETTAKTNTRSDTQGHKLSFTSSKSISKLAKHKPDFNILAAINKLEKLKGELIENPQPATAPASTEQARESSAKSNTRPDTKEQNLSFTSSKSVENKPSVNRPTTIKQSEKLKEELTKKPQPVTTSASIEQPREISAKTDTIPDNHGQTFSVNYSKSVEKKPSFNRLAAINKFEILKEELTEKPRPITTSASIEQAREISAKTDTRPGTHGQKLSFTSSKSVENKPSFNRLAAINKLEKVNEEITEKPQPITTSASIEQAREISAKSDTRPDNHGQKFSFTSSKSISKSVENKPSFNRLAAINILEKVNEELTEKPQPITTSASIEQAREISSKTNTRPDTQKKKLSFTFSKSVKNNQKLLPQNSLLFEEKTNESSQQEFTNETKEEDVGSVKLEPKVKESSPTQNDIYKSPKKTEVSPAHKQSPSSKRDSSLTHKRRNSPSPSRISPTLPTSKKRSPSPSTRKRQSPSTVSHRKRKSISTRRKRVSGSPPRREDKHSSSSKRDSSTTHKRRNSPSPSRKIPTLPTSKRGSPSPSTRKRRSPSTVPHRKRKSISTHRKRVSESAPKTRDKQSPSSKRDSSLNHKKLNSPSPSIIRPTSPSSKRRSPSPSASKRRPSPVSHKKCESISSRRKRVSGSPPRREDKHSSSSKRDSSLTHKRRNSPSPSRISPTLPTSKKRSQSPSTRKRRSPSPLPHRKRKSICPHKKRVSGTAPRTLDKQSPSSKRDSSTTHKRQNSPSPSRISPNLLTSKRGSPSNSTRNRRSPSPVPHIKRESISPHRKRVSGSPPRREDEQSPSSKRDLSPTHKRRNSPSPCRIRPTSPSRKRRSPSPFTRKWRSPSPLPHRECESISPCRRCDCASPPRRRDKQSPSSKKDLSPTHKRRNSPSPSRIRPTSPSRKRHCASPSTRKQRSPSPLPHSKRESISPRKRCDYESPPRREDKQLPSIKRDLSPTHKRRNSPSPCRIRPTSPPRKRHSPSPSTSKRRSPSPLPHMEWESIPPCRRCDSGSPPRRRDKQSLSSKRDLSPTHKRRNPLSPSIRRPTSPSRKRCSSSPSTRERRSPSPLPHRKGGSISPRRRCDSESPPRRRDLDSPSPCRLRPTSPSRKIHSPSPYTRNRRSPSPLPHRKRGSISPRRRCDSASPPRRRDLDSPSPCRLRPTSPSRKRHSPSPYTRKWRSPSPLPHRKCGSISPRRRCDSASPPRRRDLDSPSPCRLRPTSPSRKRHSPSPYTRKRRSPSPLPHRSRGSISPRRRWDSESPPRRRDSDSPSRKRHEPYNSRKSPKSRRSRSRSPRKDYHPSQFTCPPDSSIPPYQSYPSSSQFYPPYQSLPIAGSLPNVRGPSSNVGPGPHQNVMIPSHIVGPPGIPQLGHHVVHNPPTQFTGPTDSSVPPYHGYPSCSQLYSPYQPLPTEGPLSTVGGQPSNVGPGPHQNVIVPSHIVGPPGIPHVGHYHPPQFTGPPDSSVPPYQSYPSSSQYYPPYQSLPIAGSLPNVRGPPSNLEPSPHPNVMIPSHIVGPPGIPQLGYHVGHNPPTQFKGPPDSSVPSYHSYPSSSQFYPPYQPLPIAGLHTTVAGPPSNVESRPHQNVIISSAIVGPPGIARLDPYVSQSVVPPTRLQPPRQAVPSSSNMDTKLQTSSASTVYSISSHKSDVNFGAETSKDKNNQPSAVSELDCKNLPYRCRICQKRFDTKKKLSSHRYNVHPEIREMIDRSRPTKRTKKKKKEKEKECVFRKVYFYEDVF